MVVERNVPVASRSHTAVVGVELRYVPTAVEPHVASSQTRTAAAEVELRHVQPAVKLHVVVGLQNHTAAAGAELRLV